MSKLSWILLGGGKVWTALRHSSLIKLCTKEEYKKGPTMFFLGPLD